MLVKLICRSLNLDPYISPGTKLKLKWGKDLKQSAETLENIAIGKGFLNKPHLVAQKIVLRVTHGIISN